MGWHIATCKLYYAVSTVAKPDCQIEYQVLQFLPSSPGQPPDAPSAAHTGTLSHGAARLACSFYSFAPFTPSPHQPVVSLTVRFVGFYTLHFSV
jgi:hypothetical protein